MTGALVTPVQAKALCLIAGAARAGLPISREELGKRLGVSKVRGWQVLHRLRLLGLCTSVLGKNRTAIPSVSAVVCAPARCPRCQREVFLDVCHDCGVRTEAGGGLWRWGR